MANERQEYTFTWFIENYSYCWHKNGEELESPEFTTDDLEGTAWNLGIYPRGYEEDEKGYISFFLNRSKVDNGPEEFSLKCEFSFLSTDGSTLHSGECEYKFEREDGYGIFQFLQIEEVLSYKKADYLPQDTLSVRCKMWKDAGKIQRKTQIYARTRIGLEKFSFLHVTEDFSTLEPHEKKFVQISLPENTELAIVSSLYIADGSWDGERKVIVEITPCDSYQTLTIFRISLLDVFGKVILHCEADNRLDALKNDIEKLHLTVTRQAILMKKDEYLPNDTLTLRCECTFATDVEFQKIESTVLDFLPVASNLLIKNVRNKDKYGSTELLSECSSALDDFTDLYNNKLLTDVELKTKTKSFPAHKNVLCARSSIFLAMLTNDMKEKNKDCIQIDDLEDDTVQQLLLFLYSDKIENPQWESAIKLYYAADKYQIKKLKMMCVSFFMENLSTSTASELLLLADTHNDLPMRKAVEDFILNHDDEVFGSEEWGSLLEAHPLLVSKTMRLKYKR